MQKRKGISLIVLVITIIVMIILAGSIILSLNNAGIIGKANQVVDATNEATVKQLADLKWAEAYLDENVEKTDEGMYQAVIGKLQAEQVDLTPYNIAVTMKGVTVERVTSVKELQAMYEFKYYTTIEAALADVNAETVGVNANSTKEVAEAGIYTDNGKVYGVLLKDAQMEEMIYIKKDVALNLGGRELSSSTNIFEIGEKSGEEITNVNIIGDIFGSKITINGVYTSSKVIAIRINEKGISNISGGTYTVSGNSTAAVAPIVVSGNLTITKAKLSCTNASGEARALNINDVGSLNMSHCALSTGSNNKCMALYSAGNSTVSNCSLTTKLSGTKSETWGIDQVGGNLDITDCEINVDSEKYIGWGIKMSKPNTTTISNCNIKVTSKDVESQSVGISLWSGTNVERVTISNCNIVATSIYGFSAGVHNKSRKIIGRKL